ncbi:SMP-30/gluconolactonase/LRE family protein [Chondromyces apiculatus]|nr:SMP-30/gluconolactonase/LRE family protein [Chondromyces apiculatus]
MVSAAPAAAPAPPDSPLKGLEQLHAAMPQDGTVMYLLAYFKGEAGDRDAVYQWLDALARSSWDLGLDDSDFKMVAAEPRYQDLARTLNGRVTTVADAPVAFRLAERDLIPEGIAYDSKRKELLLGSLKKRKIIRIRPGGGVSEVIAPAAGGMGRVLGLRVDPGRDVLWVAADKTKDGQPPAPRAIYRFALANGALLGSYALPDGGRHLLNDLAVTGDGTVFVTDSEGGGVFRLKPGATALEPFIPAGSMVYPNGIALDAAGRTLYVADAAGIWSVDPESGAHRRLQPSPGVTIGGIDGLSMDGTDFIAVQNMGSSPRLARMTLDAAAGRVTAVKVLASKHPEFEIPTTAALVGAEAYVIANSQLRSKDETGQYLPPERLKEPVILRVRVR